MFQQALQSFKDETNAIIKQAMEDLLALSEDDTSLFVKSVVVQRLMELPLSDETKKKIEEYIEKHSGEEYDEMEKD